MTLYPLPTAPIYRHYIWGGHRLADLFGKPLGAEGRLAESWEVADAARVANGPWHGHTLRAVDEATGGALVGDALRYPQARLPLLIKLANAETNLSIQVHPDDAAARLAPQRGFPGKAEMYLILAADPGAGVYYGLRPGLRLADLQAALKTGAPIPDLLNFVPVQAGNVLYSPAGTIHALGAGLVYCEIQQNSDLTYRLYDWNRPGHDGHPRPLHIAEALACAQETPNPLPLITPLAAPAPPGTRRHILAACPYFAAELLAGSRPWPLTRARRTMQAIVVLDGTVTLTAPGAPPTPIQRGTSAVIPAACPEVWAIPDGPARLLFAYLPDLPADIVRPLLTAAHPPTQIAALAGNPAAGPLADALRTLSP